MHCARCNGLMVTIWMGDLLIAGTVKGWRCLLCGETTDPGIEANRKQRPPLTEGRPRLPGSVAAWHGKKSKAAFIAIVDPVEGRTECEIRRREAT